MADDNRGGGRFRFPFHFHPGAVLRSVLLGVSVFALAAVAGVLLSGAAAPAAPDGPSAAVGSDQVTTAPPLNPAPTEDFARSMIYTGTTGLAVSISGLVMVGRRRRLW